MWQGVLIMKKVFALILAAMLLLSMTACGAPAAPAGNETNADGKYTIGICQFLPHPALDKATEGFKDAVIAGLGEGNVTFDQQDAAGEASNCATIVNGLVSAKVDLIMANATPAVAAAYNATEEIPILALPLLSTVLRWVSKTSAALLAPMCPVLPIWQI